MGSHWRNGHPGHVNYPSDLQMSSTPASLHMCRLINSWSVCLDAVTRTPARV